MASNLGAESARAEEKEAWRSGRFWLNAFIGDAPGEKNQSPQSRRTAIVPVGGRGRTRERRVESKGCEGGLRGGRGCEPFLRHYVIRRFPGGIPTASTDDESRNFVATKRFLPGNNNTPPSPSVLHLSTVISDIRRIDSAVSFSFLSPRRGDLCLLCREKGESCWIFVGGRKLRYMMRYVSYMYMYMCLIDSNGKIESVFE